MKRLTAAILVLILLCLPVYARESLLYMPDGREIAVRSDDVPRWQDKGWLQWDQVYTVIYNSQGENREVLRIDLDLWRGQGWSDNIADMQTTLFADDGSRAAVWNDYVEDSLAGGLHLTEAEAQTLLYGADGTEMTVWNAEVEAYLTQGFYRTPEEAHTVIYSPDGAEMTVWRAEAEAYLAQGWSETPPARSTADPNRPMVALTFDDGPGPYTDKILNCLEKYGAKATFYVVGNRLGTYSKQLKREAETGMEIGCHSWSHTQLTTLNASAAANDIKRTNDRVNELTGIRPATVRPPYGSHNAAIRSAAGAPFILWSVDTLDWKTRNADSTYNAVMNSVKDGDIILMHDIHSATADAVERIVPALIERGFQLVTVSEMGSARKGGLTAGSAYSSIRP